jgi:hypothetical protein
MRASISKTSLLVTLLMAGAASACSVCGQVNDQGAYLAMTVFMSLTPLALIGGLIGWVYVRSKEPKP